MVNPAAKPDESQPATFEESLSEVEQIVRDLEDGQLGLAEALARYETGVKRLKQCQALLEGVERRIELLSGVDADGNAVVGPFAEDAAMSLDEKSRARSRRRSSKPAAPQNPPGPSPSRSDMDEPGALF